MTFLKPTLAVMTVAGLLLALPASDGFARTHAKVSTTHHVVAAAVGKATSKVAKVTKAPVKKHAAAPVKKTAHTAKAHKKSA